MPTPPKSELVFRLSCWTLGLVAFGQLLTAGVALAVRVEKAREVRVVEKEVPKILTVTLPTVAPTAPVAEVAPVVLPPLPESTPLPPPRPLAAPPIADPVVERLVHEARRARVADDMGSAITKLEDAHAQAPEDPTVLYELALVYEEMAVSDPRLAAKASDYYLEVMRKNTAGAGALYTLAAEKLRDGIAMPADLRGRMALGRVRIFKDEAYGQGQRVVVTVPVHAAPETEIGEDDLDVEITFYDSAMRQGKREILKTVVGVSEDNISYPTLPFDFATGEELIRFTYILPKGDIQQEHLFGRREYYGQVVKLIYKGEILDTQAWPRHLSSQGSEQLASHHAQQNPWDQMPEFLTEDLYNPLLPQRPEDFLPPPPNLPYGDIPPPPPDR